MQFSIITITYNRADLIGETIQSVLDQTYSDFEHIIIDDGSTDTTETVVKSYSDSRIRYFKYEHLGNISKLLNLGLQQAKGEVMAFLDSDDLWTTNKLEKIAAIFESNADIELLTHNIAYFEDSDIIGKPHYKFTNDFYENAIEKVLQFKILPFPVLVFKKKILLNKSPFNENLFDAHQDFLFTIASQHKMYFCREVLTFLRIHNGNTHKKKKVVLGFFYNYYKTVGKLFTNKAISFSLLLKGYYINTKTLLVYLLKGK